MIILVKSLFKTNRLTKKTNGNNIFMVMKSKLKQNPNNKEFILDMQGITFVSQVVFLVIKQLMQVNFEGNFILKLQNANPLIAQTFNLSFNPEALN